MKVFATDFFSPMVNKVSEREEWTWSPANEEFHEIHASGANTSSNQSTYADERDNRGDSDRPNEGMLVA
ncbi:hypothetical protein [Chitinilyticum litopenaei]|uniref:hypothetical protein n=1 Tax=Chitinilyticum litopenaei TaxID=1121276 RepID=UPI001184F217|nr:hypothetical protein [Chitinilyticum litopenaei]